MTRIPKELKNKPSGSYSRLFGDEDLGFLMSRVHSASIKSGNDLELLITNRIEKVDDLDTFLSKEIMPDGVLLATKKQIKESKRLNGEGSEPDFMIFKRREGRQHCYVVELKDGYSFDTKKAQAERDRLHRFVEKTARRIPYVTSTHFCAFNESDHQVIWNGFKRKIKFEEAMTGKEFCELLEIDYDEIVEIRTGDAEYNTQYFLTEILKIPEIKEKIEIILEQMRKS